MPNTRLIIQQKVHKRAHFSPPQIRACKNNDLMFKIMDMINDRHNLIP